MLAAPAHKKSTPYQIGRGVLLFWLFLGVLTSGSFQQPLPHRHGKAMETGTTLADQDEIFRFLEV